MSTKLKIRWKLPTSVLVVVEVVFVFFHVRSDPDPYHSGFVYAQSIAVKNGLLPHRDFLSPYGVVGPLINGAWLKLTSDSLLSLLLLYGFLTIAIGYLIQLNARRYVSSPLAKLLNFTWVVTLTTAMPWPSILTTFLTLAAVSLLLKNQASISSESYANHFYLVPVVIILHFAVLSRIHLAITPILISIFIIVRSRSFSLTFRRTWFAINILSVLIIITVLATLHLFDGFVEQVIVWPLSEFDTPPVNASFIASFIWFPLSLLIVVALIKIVLRCEITSQLYRYFVTVFCFLIFYSLYALSKHDYGSTNTNTLKNVSGFAKNMGVNLQFICGYSITMFFIWILFRHVGSFKVKKWRLNSSQSWSTNLVFILGITGLSQLYPLHDNVHLWFVAPLLTIPSMYFISYFTNNHAKICRALVFILCCLIPVQGLAFYDFVSKNRVPLSSYELRGMYADGYFQSNVDTTMKLLNSSLSKRNLRNNCIASLYSTSNGQYYSIDGNFSANFFGNFVQSVPIVDASTTRPSLFFECQVGQEKLMALRSQGQDVIFEVQLKDSEGRLMPLYNLLYAKK